jgi:hypothetical protein
MYALSINARWFTSTVSSWPEAHKLSLFILLMNGHSSTPALRYP